MIILYGLGNNEEKYLKTKHNIGRLFLENIIKKQGLSLKSENNYYYTKSISPHPYFILLNQGYMNNSGQPLQKFISYHSIRWEEDSALIIIHDDSDQAEGSWKFAQGGGSGGHHGINSIYSHILSCGIGLESIWRLKIGIRPLGNTLKSETFVLSKLTETDLWSLNTLGDVFSKFMTLLGDKKYSDATTLLHSIKK